MGVPEKALIAADEIVEYIPQRPPIVMADAFYGIGEDGCARSGLTVCEDNIHSFRLSILAVPSVRISITCSP